MRTESNWTCMVVAVVGLVVAALIARGLLLVISGIVQQWATFFGS